MGLIDENSLMQDCRAADLPACESCDVVVIGAGVIGCCVARELMRYDLRVVVLEAGMDIANGATRANSGIVHAGFDPKPGTLKARYNVRGANLFPEWQSDLGFAFFSNGAFVLAFDEGDVASLERLLERGCENGVEGLRAIGAEELRELEPNVSRDAIAALYAPTSGICDPYGLSFGAAENAVDNGAEFYFDSAVVGISKESCDYVVSCVSGRTFRARAVVNAAGVFADEMNNMVSESKLRIVPRRGEYHLYDNSLQLFRATMFQIPSAAGKGVLVGRTAFGNAFIGPNSVPQESKTSVATTKDGLSDILQKAKRTWPQASTDMVISNFAGLRASNANGGDFVIGEATDAPGFFNAACIDSPGLASAPAIAEDLASMVAQRLNAQVNKRFNPKRMPPPLLSFMPDDVVERLIDQNPLFGCKVCRCCNVTEGEIVVNLHRSLPVNSLDALKWRTGATMGPCQGGRCMVRIMQIMERELGISLDEVQKRDAGSFLIRPEESAISRNLDHRSGAEAFFGAIPEESDVLVLGDAEEAFEVALEAAKRGLSAVQSYRVSLHWRIGRCKARSPSKSCILPAARVPRALPLILMAWKSWSIANGASSRCAQGILFWLTDASNDAERHIAFLVTVRLASILPSRC